MKVSEKDFTKLVRDLPRKDQEALDRETLEPEQLRHKVAQAKAYMQQDLQVGIPWFVMYSASLYFFGNTPATILLLLLGMVFFVYRFFTTGSYGLNKRRVKAYRGLLDAMGEGNETDHKSV